MYRIPARRLDGNSDIVDMMNSLHIGVRSKSGKIHKTSSLLGCQKKAKSFLMKCFNISKFNRNIIAVFELEIIKNIKTDNQDWSIAYSFRTTYHRYIFQKLCEYYRCGHKFVRSSCRINLFYSPSQKIETKISELARKTRNGNDQRVSKTTNSKSLTCRETMSQTKYWGDGAFFKHDIGNHTSQISKMLTSTSGSSIEQLDPLEISKTQSDYFETKRISLGSLDKEHFTSEKEGSP
ncbi:hypothetical protein RF11_15244 [Thelohanellus kitauei]|uniref:Uncharacterized protein n=1 Tax=Thelohanellus kitauei TaxID=669202 RepID=A0A0C2JC88_THEKT|nr:hypothetical protein RF11_15244 [Thelohanellus kitauei]